MARGRKAKAGRREPNGRLQRNHSPTPAYDHGNERIQAARARYGVHYSTALGRAYAGGLLGDRADDLYAGGKRFVMVYRRLIGGEAYRCPLDDSPRGENVVELEPTDRDRRDHEWLFAAMDELDVAGVRPWFDQLISALNHDHGPEWMDRLLKGGRDPIDRMMLDTAIKALAILAPPPRPLGIRTSIDGAQ